MLRAESNDHSYRILTDGILTSLLLHTEKEIKNALKKLQNSGILSVLKFEDLGELCRMLQGVAVLGSKKLGKVRKD